MSADEDPPAWDAALADRLVGSEVVVGLTHVEDASTWQEQIFGTVERVERDVGIAIRVAGERLNGELYWLPPDLRQFETMAAPGDHRLRSTGEVVVNPDYAVSWTINRPTKPN